MAEPLTNGLDPRKKLYSALVGGSDKELANQVKQFSYNKFNGLLDNNDFVRDLFMDISERGIVLDPKNPNASKDPVEFANAFIYREPVAKPQPQAAPKQEFLEVPSLEEQEAYTPPAQPLVGSPEYDAKLQKQYGGMKPTLGATFGGAAASFETPEQKKQEQISPVFKAQQLAFEDVPIAEEQRKAQRQFAKAEKQQQQAAIRGGTGFEYQQEKRNKERSIGGKAEDLLGAVTSGGERIAKNVLSGISWLNQASMAADPNVPLEYEQRQQQIKDAGQRMYDASTSSQNQFQEELSKRNIQTSVLEAIDKGNYNKIPEAALYTIGDAAMQIIPSILTMGGSTYFQTLPEAYKNGVDAIAKEKGMSPEQVIASGDDAMITAQISSGIQSALERVGAGLISKSIASRGGYKAMRDWLLRQGVNRNLARAAGLLGVSSGEAFTEYGQEGTAQIGEIAAKSPTAKAFMDKLPKELFTPEATKRRAESLVGGFIGGFGLAGGGQAFQSAMDRTLFEAPKIGKATQRADMDIVQTDNKIQERNKIAQAMEEAVKGNPEAEGQIRAQYQKRVNEAAPTDDEVLAAYEGLALLPETEEKNTIRENLEAYMAEKGIQPEAAGMEAGLGEGLRVPSPEETPVIRTVNPQFPPPQITPEPVAPEVTPEPVAPAEEVAQEDEDLASLGQVISGLEQTPTEEAPTEEATPITPTEEVVTIAPLNIEFSKNEGRNVNYQGIEGRIKIDSDGAPYIFTRDGDVVYIEGGLSGQTPQQLGVQPLADDVINEADIETVLEDETAPLDQNQLQYDFDNNTITLYGKPFTYEGVETNSKGQTTALRLRDTNGKIKFVRNEDTILEFEIQKELYEKSRTNKQPTIESATAAAEQLQVVPIVRVEQVSKPVQQEGSTSDTKGDKVTPAPKGRKKAAPVKPTPAAPKKEEAPKPQPKKEETPKPEAKEEKPSKEERIAELEKEKSALTSKALKQFPNSPNQLKTRKRIDEINKELDELNPKEAKPTTGIPQEGDAVEIAPQREGGSPRKMVFKDGEWKQNVGGDIVKVGPSVQGQAQEMFAGKTETKAEPAKTNEEQIADLRVKEQAEYDSMSDPNDKAKREEIYDKYDKLISPLIGTKPSEEGKKERETKEVISQPTKPKGEGATILPSIDADKAEAQLYISQKRNYYTLWYKRRFVNTTRGKEEYTYSYNYLTILSQNLEDARTKALDYLNSIASGESLSVAFEGKNIQDLRGAKTIALQEEVVSPETETIVKSKSPDVKTNFGIGKYSGITIDELLDKDIDYAEWFVNNYTSRGADKTKAIIKGDPRYQEYLTIKRDIQDLERARIEAYEKREAERKEGKQVPVATLVRGEGGKIKEVVEETEVAKKKVEKKERRLVKDQITDIIPPQTKADDKVDDGLKPQMFKAQIDGANTAIASMDKNGVLLNGDGAGVGKTRQIIAVAKYYADKGKPVVIISENAAIGKPWESGKQPMLGGSMAKDSEAMGVNLTLLTDDKKVQPGGIYVSTYNRIQDADVPSGAIVMFDESQNLVNTFGRTPGGDVQEERQWEAKFRPMLKKAGAVAYYSATPADKPHQLAYLYKVLGFNSPEDFLSEMMNNGAIIKTKKYGKQEVKYYDVPAGRTQRARLYNWVNGLMVRAGQEGRFVKREISYEGTDVQFHDVKGTDEGRNEYAKEFNKVLDDLNDAEMMEYRLLAPNSYILYAAELSKIGEAVGIVKKQLAQGRKSIIFVSRINPMEIRGRRQQMAGEFGAPEVIGEIPSPVPMLEEALKKEGISFVGLHSKAKTTSQKAQKAFSEDADVLIASLESGGTGINLDDTIGDNPRTEVFLFSPYRGISTIQGMGRIWRASTIQNDNNPNRYVFVTASDISPDLNRSSVLAKKLQLMNAAIGGTAVSKLPMSKVSYDKEQLVGIELPDDTDEESSIFKEKTGILRPVVIDWKQSRKGGYFAKATADILEWMERGGPERTGLDIRVFKSEDGEWIALAGKNYKAEEFAPDNIPNEVAPTETEPSFTSKQESSASEEFDGTKKPSKIKTKSFDNKYGKGAFERMQNITDNFEDIMDGLSEKIKQDCL